AGLLLTHHPLLLSGVHGVPATDPKGALVHRMITSGVAHFVAHTNADVAARGVSEALARRIGLTGLRPLEADSLAALDHLTVFVPEPDLNTMISALSAAGAGAIGNYSDCTFTVEGTGTYRPLPGADPADGQIGVLRRKPETRLSMVFARANRASVLAAMRSSHPYEEIAFELTEQPDLDGPTGTGRLGDLDTEQSLTDFVALVAERLPATVWGIRAAGDRAQRIRTVAVCGGSGAGYVELARRAGADVFLTSDLKHHSTIEAVTERAAFDRSSKPMALVDAAHWATEWPWLQSLADQLTERFGNDLSVEVSTQVTDPWTVHQAQLPD
ncbi:MAG TPA: Nif3-like dinuclear metal center hexameric protein, partial [Jatrophihabitans sp.]